MKDFFMTNWFVLILALVFLGFNVYLFITKQWTKLREQAYALMLTAERVFSSEEGKKKFEAVFEALYFNLIPRWLRLFVTPESIREKLQEWYNLAKNYLKNDAEDVPDNNVKQGVQYNAVKISTADDIMVIDADGAKKVIKVE